MSKPADYKYQDMTPEEDAIVGDCLREFAELQNNRAQLNKTCEEIAARILPSSRGTFQQLPNYDIPGVQKTDQQVDATGAACLSKFMAVCDSLLTPRDQLWHQMEAEDEALAKDRAARMWYYEATKILFRERYSTFSNFAANNQTVYQSLGAFGNGVLYIDKFFDQLKRREGLRYIHIPYGQIYLKANHQGLYDGFVRLIPLTAYQIVKSNDWDKNRIPEQVWIAYEKSSQQKFTVLQWVGLRQDYDPARYDAKGMPFYNYYILQEGKCILSESGFNSFPISVSRYQQSPGEQDGRGPAADVLPSLKTLDAEKRIFLKQGHRAADPVILSHDDGLMNLSLRPGANNKGGWSADGKPLIGILPTGEIQVTLEMMQEEKAIVQDAFLVSMFQLILDRKSHISATQIMEETSEKGIFLAPTVGRQADEYLGRVIDRELDLLSMMGKLPPMPPALKRAQGQYRTRFTNPLARYARAQYAAGFFRMTEAAANIAAQTGDPSILDPFEFDIALPDIAREVEGVPEPWMASPARIAQKKQARAEAAARQEAIEAAPAAAKLMDANTKAQQAQPA